jgi:hypothetical protein
VERIISGEEALPSGHGTRAFPRSAGTRIWDRFEWTIWRVIYAIFKISRPWRAILDAGGQVDIKTSHQRPVIKESDDSLIIAGSEPATGGTR